MTANTTVQNHPRSRHWADVVGIVVGVSLIAVSIWPSGVTASSEATEVASSQSLVYLVRALAGMASIAAVLVAQRWQARGTARALMGVAGATLLISLVVFREFEARALITVLVPGILLLIAATAVGPMPAPSTAGERQGA